MTERLDRIEASLEALITAIAQIKNLENSNFQAIKSLTDVANQILPRIDDMQRQSNNMQTQSIDIQRRIDDNTADIRELALENQRILKYLETLISLPKQ